MFVHFCVIFAIFAFHVGSSLVPRALLDRVSGNDRFYKHFVSSLAPFWFPLGSILAPFWIPFGCLLPPLGVPGGVSEKGSRNVREMSRFWHPFDHHFGSIFELKTLTKTVIFFIDFFIDFNIDFVIKILPGSLSKTMKKSYIFQIVFSTHFEGHQKVPYLDFCNTFHAKSWFLGFDQVHFLIHFRSVLGTKIAPGSIKKTYQKSIDF